MHIECHSLSFLFRRRTKGDWVLLSGCRNSFLFCPPGVAWPAYAGVGCHFAHLAGGGGARVIFRILALAPLTARPTVLCSQSRCTRTCSPIYRAGEGMYNPTCSNSVDPAPAGGGRCHPWGVVGHSASLYALACQHYGLAVIARMPMLPELGTVLHPAPPAHSLLSRWQWQRRRGAG